MNNRLLIIEGDKAEREALNKLFHSTFEVTAVADSVGGLKCLEKADYAIALIDLRQDGFLVVKKAKEISPKTICMVTTDDASLDSAIEAMKLGVYDYIKKPFKNKQLQTHLKDAFDHYNSINSSAEEKSEKYSFDNIIGESEAIHAIFDLIKKVADSDSNILILGESGTGKELIARTIHHNSTRKDEPFIPVNCGAIPSELLESELFGHEKGAFTGAIAGRPGRFERADKGTIFLDEIGELAFPLQVKLLRVLQEREFERVGGNKTIDVDVRVLAATNQDLEEAVREKRFREDLYYRLNVIPILVPSLRERVSDIPLLANHFLKVMVEKKARDIPGITSDAMDMLKNYPWPGNIRELENIMERMVILKHGDGKILPGDIPEKISSDGGSSDFGLDIPGEGLELNKILDDLERGLITKALKRSDGVKSKAAELLGINRTTLIEKMKKKGMIGSEKKEAKVKSVAT